MQTVHWGNVIYGLVRICSIYIHKYAATFLTATSLNGEAEVVKSTRAALQTKGCVKKSRQPLIFGRAGRLEIGKL